MPDRAVRGRGRGGGTPAAAALAAAAIAVAAAPPTCAAARAVPAQAAAGGIGIRLVDAPVSRRADPRARSYIVDHVHPGARFSRRVEVSNGTRRSVELALYPVAATIRDGRFVVADGRTANELSSWVSVVPASVRLAPGGRALATVEVAVDPRATRGERYAAVVAELPAPPSQGGTGAVGLASRVGVRIYLSVGGGGEPVTDFEIRSLVGVRAADGTPRVTAQVRNTGARAVDLSGELTLRDPERRIGLGPFPARLGTSLAPGDVAELVVPLDRTTPGGGYDALIRLRSGWVERAATAHLTLPHRVGAGAPASATPVDRDGGTARPIAIGAALALALLGLAAWLAVRFGLRRGGPSGAGVA